MFQYVNSNKGRCTAGFAESDDQLNSKSLDNFFYFKHEAHLALVKISLVKRKKYCTWFLSSFDFKKIITHDIEFNLRFIIID